MAHGLIKAEYVYTVWHGEHASIWFIMRRVGEDWCMHSSTRNREDAIDQCRRLNQLMER